MFGGRSVGSSARVSNHKVAGLMPVLSKHYIVVSLIKRLNANFLMFYFDCAED